MDTLWLFGRKAGFLAHNGTRCDDKHFSASNPLLHTLGALVGLAIAAQAPMYGNLVSTCANGATTEGLLGFVDCTIFNLGPNPVEITGSLAYAYHIPGQGDPTDTAVGVSLVGPTPPGGNPPDFLFPILPPGGSSAVIVLTTPQPENEEPTPDFGIDDVSLILKAFDTQTGAFQPGIYGSAFFAVYDVGLATMVPAGMPPPPVNINSEQDYDSFSATLPQGAVTSMPEPRSFLPTAVGLSVIGVLLSRSRAKGFPGSPRLIGRGKSSRSCHS